MGAGEQEAERRIGKTTQPLTATEQRVVALVCEGLTNPQIARRLSVSPRTVQGHLLKVFRKLGVTSRTELAARLLRAEIDRVAEAGRDD